MTYTLSLLARNDLSNIWEFTLEHWSSDQADKYIREIIEAIEKLCDNPQSGVDYSMVREGYGGIKVKSHMVFYRNAEGNKILIIRCATPKNGCQKQVGQITKFK
ncbi:type II toxin-antitoxin system RelE/ParE family toxin [Arenibacter certesii]|uniref:Toxin n=1 Tax=Arenibacter certesii TaxID=228955 RepID=A0A918J1J0_9FLAO|nr:type II toxin-antitoxin system RelE/ParE family toxin [Arenibacter certesii]GGW42489.1 hypothetical protein GCM10007383_28820 [Arenibacter certesii]